MNTTASTRTLAAIASFTLSVLVFVMASVQVHAHEGHYGHTQGRVWKLTDGSRFTGTLMTVHENTAVLENDHGHMRRVDLSKLSTADRALADAYVQRARSINLNMAPDYVAAYAAAYATDYSLNTTNAPSLSSLQSLKANRLSPGNEQLLTRYFLSMVLALMLLTVLYAFLSKRRRMVMAVGSLAMLLLAAGFTKEYIKKSATNPLTIDSAFAAFRQHVTTSWDATYFRVGSLGIPEHEMMTGITAWQQQVPIPQCYLGANAWSIPLNPVVSANPIPVNPDHFSRGAVAIAVNGVSIFNPYTNTGVDAFLDGQLDKWGGHSGRADDYHYHTAPMHLYGKQPARLPIAYAFDGYPVYGTSEPDGSALRTLDAQHGHDDPAIGYHYHGSAAAPYMIAAFHGVVTEDSTHQLIPQAAAKGVRPALTPLKGAVITGFTANGPNGYILSYTLNNQVYKVDYSWTNTGSFTFKFINPDNTATTNTYKGTTPCVIASAVDEEVLPLRRPMVLPNPVHGSFRLRLPEGMTAQDVYSLMLVNAQGKRVLSSTTPDEYYSTSGMAAGAYTLVLSTARGVCLEKIIIE